MAVKEWQLNMYRAMPEVLHDFLISCGGWFKKRIELGPEFQKKFTDYLEREFADSQTLERIQLERLRAMLLHAGENIPYYKKLFSEHGFEPDKVDSIDDLKVLPLLTKDMVRENYDDLIFPGHKKLRSFYQSTSGTTGRPLTFLLDHNTLVHEKIWIFRHRHRLGYHPSATWRGTLNGQPILNIEHDKPPYWRINSPWKQVLFSGCHLEMKNVELYHQAIRNYKIRFFDGYPSSLYILARLLNSAGLSAPMQAVFVGAEPLYDFQRDEIERAFKCRVFAYYGLTEKVTSAGDCPDKMGLHVNIEDSVTEIVDMETGESIHEPGIHGMLVGTSLVNFSMPLIRYTTCDRSAWVGKACSCGRGLPLIEPVYTKVDDVLVTPSGKYISASILTYPFKQIQGIDESQVVQNSRKSVEVRAVVNERFTGEQEKALVAGLVECLGSDMDVHVERVKELPRTETGKFRFVVNEMSAGLINNFDLR